MDGEREREVSERCVAVYHHLFSIHIETEDASRIVIATPIASARTRARARALSLSQFPKQSLLLGAQGKTIDLTEEDDTHQVPEVFLW